MLFGGEYGSDDVICETRQVVLSQYSHIPVGNMLVVKVKQKIRDKKQGRVLK